MRRLVFENMERKLKNTKQITVGSVGGSDRTMLVCDGREAGGHSIIKSKKLSMLMVEVCSSSLEVER